MFQGSFIAQIQSPDRLKNPDEQAFFQSAIFGTKSLIESKFLYEPHYFLVQLLESFGQVIAKVKAMQIIATEQFCNQSIVYLANQVQCFLMATYQARIEYESKSLLLQYSNAREQLKKQIDIIIDHFKCEKCKKELAQMKEDKEFQVFPSCYSLKQPELYETNTVYNNVIQEDKTMQQFIQLVKQDAIKMAQQIYPHFIVMVIEFKDIIFFILLYQTQQNNQILKELIQKIRNFNDVRDFKKYVDQIQEIYPQLQNLCQELEQIRQNQINELSELTIEEFEILSLIYDVKTIQATVKPKEFYVPESVSQLLHNTIRIIQSKKEDQEKQFPFLQQQFQSEKMKQEQQLFQYIADCVHSSKLKLILLSYGAGILRSKLLYHQTYLQSDIYIINEFANSTDKEIQFDFSVSKGCHLQNQDFQDVMEQAVKLEKAVEQNFKQYILEEQAKLEQMVIESYQINLQIIQKQNTTYENRIKLQNYMKIFLRHFKLSEQSLVILLKYCLDNFDNCRTKQQSSVIKQKQTSSKIVQSAVQAQKQTQKYLQLQNEILHLDNFKETFDRPNLYEIFNQFIQQKESQKNLAQILTKFQQKHLDYIRPQHQQNFLKLLMEISAFKNENQQQFKQNLLKFYQPFFKVLLQELKDEPFEGIVQTLQIIESEEYKQKI